MSNFNNSEVDLTYLAAKLSSMAAQIDRQNIKIAELRAEVARQLSKTAQHYDVNAKPNWATNAINVWANKRLPSISRFSRSHLSRTLTVISLLLVTVGLGIGNRLTGAIYIASAQGSTQNLTLPYKGVTNSPDRAFDVRNSGTGPSIWGESDASSGVTGIGHKGSGIWGESDASSGVTGIGHKGSGIWGESDASSGVTGIGHKGSGVWGESDAQSGVTALSTSGYGIYAKSQHNVTGYFEGNVVITGGVTVGGKNLNDIVNSAARSAANSAANASIQSLQNQINALQSQVTSLLSLLKGVSYSSSTIENCRERFLYAYRATDDSLVPMYVSKIPMHEADTDCPQTSVALELGKFNVLYLYDPGYLELCPSDPTQYDWNILWTDYGACFMKTKILYGKAGSSIYFWPV